MPEVELKDKIVDLEDLKLIFDNLNSKLDDLNSSLNDKIDSVSDKLGQLETSVKSNTTSINNINSRLAKAEAMLIDGSNPICKLASGEFTYSVNANTKSTTTWKVVCPKGYRMVAIRKVSTGDGNVSLSGVTVDDSTVATGKIAFRNNGSANISSQTGTITVLFMNDDAIDRTNN